MILGIDVAFTTFIDPDGNWMQLTQRKVVTEGR